MWWCVSHHLPRLPDGAAQEHAKDHPKHLKERGRLMSHVLCLSLWTADILILELQLTQSHTYHNNPNGDAHSSYDV